MDVAFSTTEGLTVPSVVMETLMSGLCIHVSVIAAWSSILNYEEGLRQKGTTRRLFCSAAMLVRIQPLLHYTYE